MNDVIYLFVMLFAKHYICDFLLQPAYMYLNKGNPKHPGGYIHAGIHLVGTFISLSSFVGATGLVLAVSLLDAVLHFAIDYAKMNIASLYRLTPESSEFFWWLIGLDQMLHYMTYAGIIAIIHQ